MRLGMPTEGNHENLRGGRKNWGGIKSHPSLRSGQINPSPKRTDLVGVAEFIGSGQ